MPTPASTRSNSAAATALTLQDVKKLLDNNKEDIISLLKPELDRIASSLEAVHKRIDCIENSVSEMKLIVSKHEDEINAFGELLKSNFSQEAIQNYMSAEIDDRLFRLNNIRYSGVCWFYRRSSC